MLGHYGNTVVQHSWYLRCKKHWVRIIIAPPASSPQVGEAPQVGQVGAAPQVGEAPQAGEAKVHWEAEGQVCLEAGGQVRLEVGDFLCLQANLSLCLQADLSLRWEKPSAVRSPSGRRSRGLLRGRGTGSPRGRGTGPPGGRGFPLPPDTWVTHSKCFKTPEIVQVKQNPVMPTACPKTPRITIARTTSKADMAMRIIGCHESQQAGMTRLVHKPILE